MKLFLAYLALFICLVGPFAFASTVEAYAEDPAILKEKDLVQLDFTQSSKEKAHSCSYYAVLKTPQKYAQNAQRELFVGVCHGGYYLAVQGHRYWIKDNGEVHDLTQFVKEHFKGVSK